MSGQNVSISKGYQSNRPLPELPQIKTALEKLNWMQSVYQRCALIRAGAMRMHVIPIMVIVQYITPWKDGWHLVCVRAMTCISRRPISQGGHFDWTPTNASSRKKRAYSQYCVSRESRVWLNTTKEHYTGPQRIGNHEKTARLATILCNFFQIILFIFCNFVFFVLFCEFWSFSELWRFTMVTVLMSATRRDNASHTSSCKY